MKKSINNKDKMKREVIIEENNTKELAYKTLIDKLEETNQTVDKILIAMQDMESEEVFV